MTTNDRVSITLECPKCGNNGSVEFSPSEEVYFPKETPFSFKARGWPTADFYCLNDETKVIQRIAKRIE